MLILEKAANNCRGPALSLISKALYGIIKTKGGFYMICNLILFSPTGGTEKAARLLCSAIASEINTIDLTDTRLEETELKNTGSEAAVIAVPSYAGRVPTLAAERLKKIHTDKMPCILLCVYGNRAYEDTLVEAADLAAECGFEVIAAVSAVAEHSIIHKYASGRPDKTDAENLKAIGERILKKLSGDHTGAFNIPGNRPYRKANNVALVPKASDGCTSCGLCAEICPAGAISETDMKANAEKCIGCMRCVTKCPHSARRINGALVSVAALAIKKECSVRKECELYL